MRIVQANAVYDPAAKTPAELLDMYRTLTEWSVAVAQAGASVSVVQRFRTAAQVERDGIAYQFVADAERPWLSTKAAPVEFIRAIAQQSPDIVHVNGLIFPKLVAGIRAAVGERTAIVVQHHGGEFPIRGSGLVGLFQRRDWRRGLAAADAVSFTARDQVAPWSEAGVIGNQRILEIVEASTTMRLVTRERARIAVGVSGGPVILWVGRLTTNKDPLAVLDGLELALPKLPGAQVLMVFGDDTLVDSVEQRVRGSGVLQSAVTLHPRVGYEEMPNFYGAADVFISGSHSEGSGYALIEAMAAAVVPVVTDIPSFRSIAGDCGRRWTPGDAGGLAAALVETLSSDLAGARQAVREHFERTLSWNAIAARTVREYESVRSQASRAVKIALVVPGGLHPSGEQEVVPSWLALFEELSKQHELHAFVLKHLPDAQAYQLRGFTVHDLGRPSAALGLTRWAQERALTAALGGAGRFDLIHGFFADPAGQLAARAGRRLNIPSVVTCDSGEFVSLPGISYGSQRTARGRRVVEEACTLATRVHVCTTFMAALAALHDVKTAIIPLTSITAEAAKITVPAKGRDRNEPFRLVQVASLSRVKNQRLLIDTLRIVREKVNAHLDLVGEDTLGGELQKYAADCGLGPHVTFHGFLPQAGVWKVLSTADLYVQSSLHEAAGVSVLEAAAAGVPALGTLAGYVADWSPFKAMALGDAIPESLADAILTLHAEPDQRRSMAAAARTFALAHDAAWSAAKFDELYRSVRP